MKKSNLQIGVLLLIIGSALLFAGMALGGSPTVYIDSTGIHTAAEEKEKRRMVDDALGYIDSIEADLKDFDIEIVSSVENRIEIHDSGEISYSFDNGILKIRQDKSGRLSIMNIGFTDFYAKKITAYVARNALSSINIASKSGSVSIDGIDANKIYTKSSNGGLKIRDSRISTLYTDCDNGSFSITDSDVGSISEIMTSNGKISAKLSTFNGLNASAKNGDIRFEGCTLLQNSIISATNGDIKVITPQKKDDFRYNFSSENGTVKVDGVKKGGKDSLQKQESSNSLNISDRNGSITVEFNR